MSFTRQNVTSSSYSETSISDKGVKAIFSDQKYKPVPLSRQILYGEQQDLLPHIWLAVHSTYAKLAE